jgi:two-component system, OmpR family, response regulator RpaB
VTTPSHPPYTVLLVDDNADLRRAVTIALEELGGFQIITACDGLEGLERFFETTPDCVVIDIKMPGLNGYQLVRAFRGDASTVNTPLVLLTALAQEKDQFAGLASGADYYLVKPVKPQILAATILQAIELSIEERTQRYLDLLERPLPED